MTDWKPNDSQNMKTYALHFHYIHVTNGHIFYSSIALCKNVLQSFFFFSNFSQLFELGLCQSQLHVHKDWTLCVFQSHVGLSVGKSSYLERKSTFPKNLPRIISRRLSLIIPFTDILTVHRKEYRKIAYRLITGLSAYVIAGQCFDCNRFEKDITLY